MVNLRVSFLIAALLLALACSEASESPIVASEEVASQEAVSEEVASPAAATPDRPDVILVTWDTTRWDHVGPPADVEAGSTPGPSPTPTWDRFAREGVVFTEARTTAPVTLPAHTSILTGLQPPRHGVRDNGVYQLQESVPTLAEEFARAGYLTGAFVSAEVLHRRHGLDRGFDRYDFFVQQSTESKLGVPQRQANETVDSAISWLTLAPIDRPLFLWLHLYDPHRSWEAPAPFSEQHDPYRAEIAFTDAETGRLFDYLTGLGRLRRSLVVITGDHGEGLGEHGERTHVYFAYDSTMRVPLLFWAGHRSGISLEPGARIDGIASHVDLAPTLRALTELPEQPTDGHSLVPQLGGEPLPDRLLPFESVTPALGFGTAPIFGVVSSKGDVWIDLPRRERFDIRRDPGQTQNLYSEDDAAEADSLFAQFPRDWPPGSGGALDLDAESRARLEALGYTIGPASGTVTDSGVDPKDRTDVLDMVATDFSKRKTQRILEEFSALRAKYGPIPNLVTKELHFLDKVGRSRDALELAEETVAAYPDRTDIKNKLDNFKGLRQAKQDRIAEIRLALQKDPGNAKLRTDQAALLYGIQEHEESEKLYREIVADDPDNYEAVINLARLLVSLERDDEALEFIRLLLSRPGYPVLYDCLAGDLLLSIQGQREQGTEAIRACEARGGEISDFRRSVLDGTVVEPGWD